MGSKGLIRIDFKGELSASDICLMPPGCQPRKYQVEDNPAIHSHIGMVRHRGVFILTIPYSPQIFGGEQGFFRVNKL